jgi:UDP-N-acetylmuramyl pentapeptide phosphotransferase/UDP-N-acetylglucosamine-1-phosphate transferase
MVHSAEVWLGLIFAFAAIVSTGLIAVLRPLLVRYALARPNARSSHSNPTPQGGGIAVVVATAMAPAAAAAFDPSLFDEPFRLAIVFVCAIALGVVGVTDDIRPMEALPRLLLQGATVFVILALLPQGLHIIPMLPWWFERGLLFVGLLWFVNLVNFMDGIDWMTVAEVVPLTAALAAFGLLGALPNDGTVIATALCGAMLGFAPFNRPVARVFLGDVGSLPIGLLLAWLLVLLADGHLAAAALLPLYYVADATITLLRRLVNGERVMQAHRSHFYQRATNNGFTVYQIVGRVFALNVALAALAATTLATPSHLLHMAAFAVGCVLVSMLLYRFAQAKPR